MSSKSGSSSRTGSPRAMPMETIITRFKSAQQRKLREMDRSMHKITELLKSPKRKRRTAKIQPQTIKKERPESPKKEKEDVQEQETAETEEEYYPTKLKRHIVLNKVLLKPKDLTVIATINKRKRTIPQKDLSSAKDSDASDSEDSPQPKRLKSLTKDVSLTDMDEMIRLIEANGGVDDEGMVEILTCPSPVWWEDPPDGYHEEALFTRPRSTTEMYPSVRSQIEDSLERKRCNTPNVLSRREKNKCATENEHEQVNEQKVDSDSANIDVRLSLNNCDEKFIAKRSKLETVLGCLKNKVGKNDGKESDKVAVIKNISSNCDDLSDDEQKAVVYEILETDSEATDDERLTDVSFHDDDHLNILENMNIPIQSSVSTDTSKCTNPNECEDKDFGDCKIEQSDSNEIGDDCRDFLGANNAEIFAANESTNQTQFSNFLDRTKNRDFLEHDKTIAIVDNREGILRNELSTSNNFEQHSSHISELENSDAISDEIQTSSNFLERARSTFLDNREVIGHENETSSIFLDADEISLTKDVRQQKNSLPINYKVNEDGHSNVILEDTRNLKFENCEQQINADEQISREVFQPSRNIAATPENDDIPNNVETKSTNFLEENNVSSFSEQKIADEELQTVYVYEEFEDAEEPQEEPSGDFLDEDRRFEENHGHKFEHEPIQYGTRTDINYEHSETVGNHHEVELDSFQEVYDSCLTDKSKKLVKKTDINDENEKIDHFKEIKAATNPKENYRGYSFHQTQNINNFDKGLRNVENIEAINIQKSNNFEEEEAATNFLINESTNSQEYNRFREIRTPEIFNLVNEYDERNVQNHENLENSGIIKKSQISDFETPSILRKVLTAESNEKYEPDSTLDEYIGGYKKAKAGNILDVAYNARAFSEKNETKEQKLIANKEAVPTAQEDKVRYDDDQESFEKDQTIYEETHDVNSLEEKKVVFAESLNVNDHPKENGRGETYNSDDCEDNLFLEDTLSNNNYEAPIAYEEPVPYEKLSIFQEAQSVNYYDRQDIFEDAANNYEQQNTFEESLTVKNDDSKRTIYEKPANFQEPSILHNYKVSPVNNYEKQKSFKEASTVNNYETNGNIDEQSSSYVEPHIPTNFGQLLASRSSRTSVYSNHKNKDSSSKTGDEIDCQYAERQSASNSAEVQSIRDLQKIQSNSDLMEQQNLCHFNAQTVENFEIESIIDIKNHETVEKKSESRERDSDENQSTNHADVETIGNDIAPIINANHAFNVNYENRQSNCNLEQLKSNINLQKEQTNNEIEERLSFGVQKDGNFEILQVVNTYKDVIDVDKFVNEQRASNANGQSDLNSKTTPANIFLETESMSDSEDNDALVIVETPQDMNPFKKIDFDNLPSSEKFLETQSFNGSEKKQSFNNFELDNVATNIIETTNRFNDTKSVTKINVDQPNDGEKVNKTPSFSCANDFEEYVANIIKKLQSAENNTGNRTTGVNDTKNKEDLEKSHTSLLEEYLTVDLHELEPVEYCNSRNGLKKPESTSNVIKFRNPDETSINILKIESVIPRNMPLLKSCGSRRCNEGCLPTSNPPPIKRYPGVIQTNFATEPKTILFDTIDAVTNLLQDKLDPISDSNVCILNEDGENCVETTEYNNGVRITSINMPSNKNTKTINLCSNRSNNVSRSTQDKNVDDSVNENCTNSSSFAINLSQKLCLYGSEFEFAHNSDASDFEVQSLTITKLNNVNQHQPPYDSEKSYSCIPRVYSNSKKRSHSKNKNSEKDRSRNNNVVKHNDWNAVHKTKTSQFEQNPMSSDKAAKKEEKIEYYYKQCKNFYEKQKYLGGKIDVTNRNIILDKSLITKKHSSYVTNNQSQIDIQLNCAKNTTNKKIEITNDVIINKITNGNNQITINRMPFDNQNLTNDHKTKSTNNVDSDNKQNSLNDLGSKKILLPNKGLTINKILVTTKELESIMKNSAINLATCPKQDANNEHKTTKPQTPYNGITFNKVQFANNNKYQKQDGTNESIGLHPHDPKLEVTISKVPLAQHEYENNAEDDVSNNSGITEFNNIPVANHDFGTPETNNDFDSFSNTGPENELRLTKAEWEIKKSPLNKKERQGSIKSKSCHKGGCDCEKNCNNVIDSFMVVNELPNEFQNANNNDVSKSIETNEDEYSTNKMKKHYEFLIPETPKTRSSNSGKGSNKKLQNEFINELETDNYVDSTNTTNYEFFVPDSSNTYSSDAEKNYNYELNNHTMKNEINNESQNVKNDFLISECPESCIGDSRKHSNEELNLTLQNNAVKDADSINVFKEDEANNNGVSTNTKLKENNKGLVHEIPKPCSSNCEFDSNDNKSNATQSDIDESQNTKTDDAINKKDEVSTSKIKKDGEFRVPDPPKPRVKKNKVNKLNRVNNINKMRNEKRLILKSKSKQVKFCMQCSSIYDTKLCNYCFRRSRTPNVVNQCNKHYIFKMDCNLACEICKYKASSKANLQQHMLSKRCGSSKR